MFKLGGRRQPLELFDLARTRFENLALQYLYQDILVNFFMVLISIQNYMLYPENQGLLQISGLSKPSSLRQTGPKNR